MVNQTQEIEATNHTHNEHFARFAPLYLSKAKATCVLQSGANASITYEIMPIGMINTQKRGTVMAKKTLELLEGEVIIGDETVAMRLSLVAGNTNRLFITNKRICFVDTVYPFAHTLDEIEGFKNGLLGATIVTKSGKHYKFTTSSAKQVKAWLREAGVLELDK